MGCVSMLPSDHDYALVKVEGVTSRLHFVVYDVLDLWELLVVLLSLHSIVFGSTQQPGATSL